MIFCGIIYSGLFPSLGIPFLILAVTENQFAAWNWHADKFDRFAVVKESAATALKLNHKSGKYLPSHFGGSDSMPFQSTWVCDGQSGIETSCSTSYSVFPPVTIIPHRCSIFTIQSFICD
jgi:hypothetical protein